MESQRTFLFIGLMLVSFLLFQEWNSDYGPQPQAVQSASTQVNDATQSTDDTFIPSSSDSSVPGQIQRPSQSYISVTTDVLTVKLDTKGGDIVEVNLLQYPTEQHGEEPFMLLGELTGNQYYSQSGLIGIDGPDASPNGRPIYNTTQPSYTLAGDELRVPMTYVDAKGIEFIKTYVFKAGNYAVEVEYTINNSTANNANVQLFSQIKRTIQDKGSMIDQSYLGFAYGAFEKPYEKYSFSDIEDKNISIDTAGGYVSFIQHYFVSAWVPKQDEQNNIYSRKLSDNSAIMGVKGPVTTIAAGQQEHLSATFYVGPKDQAALKALHDDLDLTVDYGWLFFISQPLFDLLKWLYALLGNWGLAIIAITIIVKTLLYPLTKAQYTSMAKMRNLQPKIMALKEKHGDDKQKFGQAMMEMYRKEKVNPMGGCFPLLLQMPIFLALFYVFLESVELRHAEFGLWLMDLSAKDPYYILPILFGASMFLTQKLQPMTVTDPMQQKMMTYMPVIFSVFFLWFPSGLVLYWLVSNLISIAQMLIIYRGMEKKGIKVRG
ncbi:YidC/Oxa1 family membrane protein insertase [Pseudoalteromonas ulvae UL12]|uniref:Membrane protein insertase YidC n=1 Tax=Pseudoalteromonas ulvae TaxID=107327 RepID=A0A2D0A0S4_PSEDV|nr:membrane protein insertase YidC [Pseudoalteromonas ulvae]MBE0364543.1 YidC/Oxa1 family membrane protein insertase [Pseudoalteromonas ulvae UL12]OUL56295.1 membrane protein insertase YidC [Pseudoalteromonas ulvae]